MCVLAIAQTKASPSLVAASRWGGALLSLFPIIPLHFATTMDAGWTRAAAVVVEAGIAVDITYWAGADDALLL